MPSEISYGQYVGAGTVNMDGQAKTIGFQPNNISGLSVWLSAKRLSAANGAAISAWTPVNGLGNAPSGSGTQRPTFNSTGINNRPSIQFNGSTNYLQSATFATAITQPYTTFIVWRHLGATEQLAIDGLDTSNRGVVENFPGNYIASFAGNALTQAPAQAGPVAIMAEFNGASNSKLCANNGTITTGNAGTNSLTGITVGGRFSGTFLWVGHIGEILIYNRALTAAERTKVFKYLGKEWGITVSG